MKKVFAILLAFCLLLSLAACGKPAGTTGQTTTAAPTTAPDATIDLVTAYETDSSASMGAFSMEFAYDSDYRSGTMTMRKDGQDAPGTFTCDENYNINHMQIDLEKVEAEKTVLLIDCTFDNAHRILTAKVVLKNIEGERTLQSAEYSYDPQGRRVYSKVEVPGQFTSVNKIEYREDGQVLRQTTEYKVNGVDVPTTVMGYDYDEEGHIKALVMYDGEGNKQMEMPATYEVKEDGTYYTLEMDGNKMVLVVNDKTQIVLQETYSGGDLINRIKTEFDEAGRAIRLEQWVAYTNATTVITYVYTADGRLQESKQVTGDQEIIAQRTTFQTVEIPG